MRVFVLTLLLIYCVSAQNEHTGVKDWQVFVPEDTLLRTYWSTCIYARAYMNDDPYYFTNLTVTIPSKIRITNYILKDEKYPIFFEWEGSYLWDERLKNQGSWYFHKGLNKSKWRHRLEGAVFIGVATTIAIIINNNIGRH